MNGFLLYYEEDAKKNQSYINWYKESGKALKMDISLLLVDSLELSTITNQTQLPDFIINRTRNPEIAKTFENLGIRVFNSSKVCEIGNDKWKTYNFIEDNLPEILIAKTNLLGKEKLRDYLFKKEFSNLRNEFPIVKHVHGHGGNQVFKLSNDLNNDEINQQIFNNLCNVPVIIQEQIAFQSCPKDIRVYVIGNKIYDSICRIGKTGDFRANYSLGGTVEPYCLTNEQILLVQKILDILPMDYAGIDFIVSSDGKWIFNEIEDMVGARMLCKCTNKKPVDDYLQYIKTSIEFR